MRLLFYCHNVHGLGHIIRSVRIAEAALRLGADACRIVTGCRFLDKLEFDPAVEVERLPAVTLEHGRFLALEGEEGDVMARRSARILAAARDWSPDAIVVDHLALGLGGELMATLLAAADEGWPTLFAWGMRDVSSSPDHPGHAPSPPKNPRIRKALKRYDMVLAYTDQDWIDPLAGWGDYPLPRSRVYTGVIAARPPRPAPAAEAVVVGLAGGGTGGRRMFEDLLGLKAAGRLPEEVGVRLVAGPFGRAGELARKAEALPRVEVWPLGSVEEAVRDASVAVARVGYNTAYSLIQTDLPLVLTPLPTDGEEQIYRARRLAELAGVWSVDEREPGAAEALAGAVLAALETGPTRRDLPFGTAGAERAAEAIIEAAGAKRGGV